MGVLMDMKGGVWVGMGGMYGLDVEKLYSWVSSRKG